MKLTRVLPLLLVFCVVLASSFVAGSAAPVQIWFVPLTWNLKDSNLKESGPKIEYTKHDFPALLQPGSAWQNAASHVTVVEMPGNVVWSYPDLPGLIAFLQAHHFKVAFSDGMLFTGGTCGKGIEGMSQDPDANRESIVIAQKWKAAGGSLDYVVMDGPLYYGTRYAKDCHYSMPEVARRVGATLAGIRNSFPDVRVVDAEGPAEYPDSVWLADMADWFKEFQRVTGRPIEAVELDLHWSDMRPGQTFQTTAQRSSDYFHKLGVRTGLIINADAGPNTTDAEWMDANREHISAAAKGGLGLDFIALNQWQNHPTLNLPETDPNAYTSLIDFAVAQTWK
jgi:hypothetical protein